MAAGTALAIGGATLLGGMMQADAAGRAATAQENAAKDANRTQLRIFNQQREDAKPWRDAGVNALNQIQAGMGDFNRGFTMSDFQADPGYAFRMAEGQKAIERSAAARGGLNSGATMKALTRYGQDVGSQEYQNAYNRFHGDQDRRFNRLSSLAGIGQTANSQIAQAGQNYANNYGQNVAAIGNASAAGQIGQANAVNNMVGTGMNTWMGMQYLNKMGGAA